MRKLERAPVSVVIPTIGRITLLERCLQSIAACEDLPSEVVLVDQSGGPAVRELASRFDELHPRVVSSNARNVAVARNLGLRSASNDMVLFTDDDCRVARSWVTVGWAHLRRDPQAIVTGRVLAGGDPRAVPSTKVDPDPRDFTGERERYVLFSNNMALRCSNVLDFGGFDHRFQGAEDNDLCYRWLCAGRALRYEPDLVVWHDEWRTHAELAQLYVAYARSQGIFYAKHLRHGDLTLLRALLSDLRAGLRSVAEAPFTKRPRWMDPRRAIVPWMLVGLAQGWPQFKRS